MRTPNRPALGIGFAEGRGGADLGVAPVAQAGQWIREHFLLKRLQLGDEARAFRAVGEYLDRAEWTLVGSPDWRRADDDGDAMAVLVVEEYLGLPRTAVGYRGGKGTAVHAELAAGSVDVPEQVVGAFFSERPRRANSR